MFTNHARKNKRDRTAAARENCPWGVEYRSQTHTLLQDSRRTKTSGNHSRSLIPPPPPLAVSLSREAGVLYLLKLSPTRWYLRKEGGIFFLLYTWYFVCYPKIEISRMGVEITRIHPTSREYGTTASLLSGGVSLHDRFMFSFKVRSCFFFVSACAFHLRTSVGCRLHHHSKSASKPSVC